jgi:hypothetical protein
MAFFTEIENLDKKDKPKAIIFFTEAGKSSKIFEEIYAEWKRIVLMKHKNELISLNIPSIDTSSKIYIDHLSELFGMVDKIKISFEVVDKIQISNEEFERLESYIEDNKICTEKDLQKILEKKNQEIFFITRKAEFHRLIKDILGLQSIGFLAGDNNKKFRVDLFHSNGEAIHRLLAQQNNTIDFSQIRNALALWNIFQDKLQTGDISSVIIKEAIPVISNDFFNYIKNKNEYILISEQIPNTELQTEILYIYLSKEILKSKSFDGLIDLIIEHIKNVINSRESKRNDFPIDNPIIKYHVAYYYTKQAMVHIPVCPNNFMKIVIVAEDLSNSEIIIDMDSEFIINDCLAGSNTTNNEIVFDVNLVEKINPKESFIKTRKALEKIVMDLLYKSTITEVMN